MKQGLLLGVLGVTLLLGGCWPDSNPVGGSRLSGVKKPGSWELSTLDQGVKSGVREELRLVLRDPHEWQELWRRHTAGQFSPSPPPVVDFTREMVIAVFLGEKTTAGYTVEVVEARMLEDTLHVRVKVASPPPGVFLLPVLTQPFHIVKVRRYDGPVAFTTIETVGKD